MDANTLSVPFNPRNGHHYSSRRIKISYDRLEFWPPRSSSNLDPALSFPFLKRCRSTNLSASRLERNSPPHIDNWASGTITMEDGCLPMNLSDLTPQELKALVTAMVDDRLRELLGDPDLGLELVDSVRACLKNSPVSTERLTGEEVAEKLGLRW